MELFARRKVMALLLSLSVGQAVAAGIPVADALNLQQNLMGYIESLSQGVQQLTDYTLQLKQYENELLRYQELVAARQMPGSYLYDSVFDVSSEMRRGFEFGGRLGQQYTNVDDYARAVVNGVNISPCGPMGCSDGDLSAGALSVQNANQAYRENLQHELAQSRREVERLQNNADERQRALMNQIRSSTSQIQSMHAGAQASAAVAEAITTQTVAMQQMEHNSIVRQAQASEAARLADQQARNLTRFTQTGNTNYDYWDGNNRRLYNLNPSLSWK